MEGWVNNVELLYATAKAEVISGSSRGTSMEGWVNNVELVYSTTRRRTYQWQQQGYFHGELGQHCELV